MISVQTYNEAQQARSDAQIEYEGERDFVNGWNVYDRDYDGKASVKDIKYARKIIESEDATKAFLAMFGFQDPTKDDDFITFDDALKVYRQNRAVIDADADHYELMRAFTLTRD